MSLRNRVMTLATLTAIAVFTAGPLRAGPAELLTPAQVRWSADQIQVSKSGDALLIGHVTVELPVATAVNIEADRSTRQRDGARQFEGNVSIRLGGYRWTTGKAVLGVGTMTPNGPTTLIRMEQALVKPVSGAGSRVFPADLGHL